MDGTACDIDKYVLNTSMLNSVVQRRISFCPMLLCTLYVQYVCLESVHCVAPSGF